MAKKRMDISNLTAEQIKKSDDFIKIKNNEKIEIRIPAWVNSILESDAKNYFSDDTTKNTVVSLAMFSFDEYLKDQKDTTEKLLQTADTYAKNKYGAKLQKIDSKNLIANLKPFDFKFINDINHANTLFVEDGKNTVLRITPTKRNAWILQCYNSMFAVTEDYNHLSMTSCISSVLTWYASFPGYKREQILFNSVYESIQSAIKSKKGHYYDFYMESGNNLTVLPYKIVTHKEGIHNYLIGIGSPEHYAPISLRMDRITKIIPNYTLETKTELTDTEQSVLDAMIKYGPEFAYPDFHKPITIIRFNADTQKKYEKIYIHRPIALCKTVNEDGTVDYTFECTERQLFNYFKKFDSPYTILKSDTLKDLLIEFYTEALKQLNQNI